MATLVLKPPALSVFYARVFFEHLLQRPQLLSMLRPLGIDWFGTLLDDYSNDELQKQTQDVHRLVRMLLSYQPPVATHSKASSDQANSYWVLVYFLRDMADLELSQEFAWHPYIINQFEGVQNAVPAFLLNFHQIRTVSDAQAYIQRLQQVPVALRQVMGQLRRRQAQGISTPRFVLDRCVAGMEEFVSGPAEQHPLCVNLGTKLRGLQAEGNCSSAKAQSLMDRALRCVQQDVYAAYRELAGACRAYSEACHGDLRSDQADHGVWRLPQGDVYYQRCLRHHTTTDLPPDQIHAMGMEAVKDYHHRIRQLLREDLGLETADMRQARAHVHRLRQNPKHLYTHLAEGEARETILQDYRDIISDIDAKSDRYFNVRPPKGCAVERMPLFKEAGSPGAYYFPPALDGSKPGTFYVNLRSIPEAVKWEMRTLAYHEAVPGHHFQLAVAQTLALPFFRRVVPFTAYQEGYALYAEHLAAEQGFHEDPLSRLGYLSAQLFRAARLAVDTGIHHLRWTREQAIDWMVDNTLMAESEVVTEVERYFIWPGQACAYFVGFRSILDLRTKAQAVLGEGFDLKAFHDVLLTNGALPLSLLEEVVTRWIDDRYRTAKT